MEKIYLDNSATTALCEEAKEAMISAMESFGNPSSLHYEGLKANKLLCESRQKVLSALCVKDPKDGELIFTSCGTEADNIAVFGSVYAKKRRAANRIITTNSEHPAIENAMKKLEEDGFEVIRLSTRDGVIDLEEFKNVMNDSVLLVSIMMVNNETGAYYDVKRLFKYAKSVKPDVITHCDAVQGFMKVKFSPKEIYADLLTVSAHKIHGPKGVGALYVSSDILRKKQLVPIMQGGGQEHLFRSGTENIIGIVGFGAAAEASAVSLSENIEKMDSLRKYAIQKLSSLDVRFNIPKGAAAPHILNITLPSIKSETMLHHLSADGICVSSGSACSSHSHHISASLHGFGLSDFDSDCSLRISLSEYNTIDDIDCLEKSLKAGLDKLVRIRKK